MKIVIIADSHSLHENYGDLPEGDTLIHAGDFLGYGREEELREHFHPWWESLPYEHKIIIAGNHDGCMEKKPELAEVFKESGTHYLLDSFVIINGIKFYGSPWTPTFLDWYFMLDRGEPIAKMWDMIPEDTDVLITHGPPHGYGDANELGVRTGCEDLYLKLVELQPTYHICGNIHEGYGIRQLNNTTLINVSNFIGLIGGNVDKTPPIVIDF